MKNKHWWYHLIQGDVLAGGRSLLSAGILLELHWSQRHGPQLGLGLYLGFAANRR